MSLTTICSVDNIKFLHHYDVTPTVMEDNLHMERWATRIPRQYQGWTLRNSPYLVKTGRHDSDYCLGVAIRVLN